MKQIVLIVVVVIVVAIVAVLSGAFYVVNETQQVIITQFGQPKGDGFADPLAGTSDDGHLAFQIEFGSAVFHGFVHFYKREAFSRTEPREVPG